MEYIGTPVMVLRVMTSGELPVALPMVSPLLDVLKLVIDEGQLHSRIKVDHLEGNTRFAFGWSQDCFNFSGAHAAFQFVEENAGRIRFDRGRNFLLCGGIK